MSFRTLVELSLFPWGKLRRGRRVRWTMVSWTTVGWTIDRPSLSYVLCFFEPAQLQLVLWYLGLCGGWSLYAHPWGVQTCSHSFLRLWILHLSTYCQVGQDWICGSPGCQTYIFLLLFVTTWLPSGDSGLLPLSEGWFSSCLLVPCHMEPIHLGDRMSWKFSLTLVSTADC